MRNQYGDPQVSIGSSYLPRLFYENETGNPEQPKKGLFKGRVLILVRDLFNFLRY